jgi:hypothetical protein
MQAEAVSEKKIQRAIKLSRLNGWSVAGFAGLCAVVVLPLGSFFGFVVGFAVALSGIMELRGHALLKQRSVSSIPWLVGSQVYLIAVLWAYASYNIMHFDAEDPWARFSPGFKDLILSINPDVYLVEAMLKIAYSATYFSLIIAVLLYQGGLCLYYLSRKKYLYAEGE